MLGRLYRFESSAVNDASSEAVFGAALQHGTACQAAPRCTKRSN